MKYILIFLLPLLLLGCDKTNTGLWKISKSSPTVYGSNDYSYHARLMSESNENTFLEFSCSVKTNRVYLMLNMDLKISDYFQHDEISPVKFIASNGDTALSNWGSIGIGSHLYIMAKDYELFNTLLMRNNKIYIEVKHKEELYQFEFNTENTLDAFEKVLEDCKYVN